MFSVAVVDVGRADVGSLYVEGSLLFSYEDWQFRVDYSVRVNVALVRVVNGDDDDKVDIDVVDVVDVDFKVDIGVKDVDDVGVGDVPDDCRVARSKTWSPCTGWNTSLCLCYSLASKRLSWWPSG